MGIEYVLLFVVVIDKVEKHQACFKFYGRLALLIENVAVFLLLFFRREKQMKAAVLVELYESRFVVSIDNKEATARLITLAAEPCFHEIDNLRSEV